MVGPPKPPHGSQHEKKNLSEYALCPYFWVDTTADAKIANMKESWYTFDGVRVPFLENTKALKLHDKLFMLKEAREAAKPLSNVMIITSEAAPASAKAKKGATKKSA